MKNIFLILSLLFISHQASAEQIIPLQPGDIVFVNTGLTSSSSYGISNIWGTVGGVFKDKYGFITLQVNSYGNSYTLPYQPYLVFKKSADGGQIIALANESIAAITQYIGTYIGNDPTLNNGDLKINEWKIIALVKQVPGEGYSGKNRLILSNRSNDMYYVDIGHNTILGNTIDSIEGKTENSPQVLPSYIPTLLAEKCAEEICIGDEFNFGVSIGSTIGKSINNHQDFLGRTYQSYFEKDRQFESYSGTGKVTRLYYSKDSQMLYIRFTDKNGKERLAPKSAILQKNNSTEISYKPDSLSKNSKIITFKTKDVVLLPVSSSQSKVCSILSFSTYLYVDYMFGFKYYSSLSTEKHFTKEDNPIAELNCSGKILFAPVKDLAQQI